MKLLCSCGHVNHVHFAGTGHCHQWSVETVPVVTGSGGTFVDGTRHVRCHCERFVPKIAEQRADLA